MASAFICFLGPYPSNYRVEIGKHIRDYVKASKIDHDPGFDFARFMTTEAQVREWNVKDLPSDDFSTQNAILITKSNKWCTVIDPQG